MKRISLMVLTTLVLVGFTAIASIAGVKTIRPDELQLFNPGAGAAYEQCADFIKSMDTRNVAFTAQVKLPVGKKIIKVLHYHEGYLTSSTPRTSVTLYRTKMGEKTEFVAFSESTDATGIIRPAEGDIYIPKIKRDYIYWVDVVSDNYGSYLKGIKIYYK